MIRPVNGGFPNLGDEYPTPKDLTIISLNKGNIQRLYLVKY